MIARAVAAVLSLAALVALGCKHTPTVKEQQASEIHYDLGIQAQNSGNMQEAYGEFERALALDPKNARAHDAMGVVLHLGFRRADKAEQHFREAIRLDPQFSEAKVNLGNVFLERGRLDEAIALYEQALNDMRYPTPFIAQGNLGWALYKQDKVPEAIEQIRASVTTNPKFCLGYRNLGAIYDRQGKVEDACVQYARYRENCPDEADAYYREAVCLAKAGRAQEAAARFAECEAKARPGDLKDDCRRLGEQLQ
jgi:type IV pilus assembly protein PilF